MKPSEIFFSNPDFLEKDPLSTFINDYNLIPNCFGHQFDNPGAICNNRIIGDFEIIYVIGGDSNITIGEIEYKCEIGDVIFIPPFTKHKIQTSSKNPHNNFWIHFDVYPFYKHDGFISAMTSAESHKTKMLYFDEVLYLYQLLKKEISENASGSYTIFKAVLTQIIAFTLKSKPKNSILDDYQKNVSTSSTDIVNKCTELIKDNIDKSISVSDLCRELNISESYLYKSFIKVLKLSPVHFISLYKIKRAEQLMKSTSLSLKEISYQLGFSSPYYFSNVFKKFYNVSPNEYIRLFNY